MSNNESTPIDILNEYVSNSNSNGNKQEILKAIEDLNLTIEAVDRIRDALVENSPGQLETDGTLLTVYNVIIKLKDDHRSYFHIGLTESYKAAVTYIFSRGGAIGSIKKTGYGAFFLNKQNYEMHVDKIIQKIKNGHMISEENKHVSIHPDRLAKIEGNIIEYRNSLRLRNSRSSFQFFTATPKNGERLPPQILAVIEEIPHLDSELREDIWNILAEAMIDRAHVYPLGPERSSNMILLARAYIVLNNIPDGQLVSDSALLQKLYNADNGFWVEEAWSRLFYKSTGINDSGKAIISFLERELEEELLRLEIAF